VSAAPESVDLPDLHEIPTVDPRFALAPDGTVWSQCARGGRHEHIGRWHPLQTRNGIVAVRTADGARTERSPRRLWALTFPGVACPIPDGRREDRAPVVHLGVERRPACGERSLDAVISSLPGRTTCARCRGTEAWEMVG
ncbi:MAG: hypothetical protein NUW01_02670, partial [Gemmatimonadaceae bacterium]|nr:hypothetical protein [Gemmatimonadaceae bacterium]